MNKINRIFVDMVADETKKALAAKTDLDNPAAVEAYVYATDRTTSDDDLLGIPGSRKRALKNIAHDIMHTWTYMKENNVTADDLRRFTPADWYHGLTPFK